MPLYNQIRHHIQSDPTEQRENAEPIKGDALMGSSEKEAYIVTLGGLNAMPKMPSQI
jgi:hypothetical protein